MSGHSKWHSIKHKKAAVDAKRGAAFTKVLKEIQIAARMGGSDPAANPRLRTAVQTARDINLPKDNIERAVKKGAGELEGVSYEDFMFEGYGQGGVALLIQGTTDNMNRTAPEIRHMVGKYGGNLGAPGCVAWMFKRRGVIELPDEGLDEDKVMEAGLEAGADDVIGLGGYYTIYSDPNVMETVRQALEAAGIRVESSKVQYVPDNSVKIDNVEDARKLLKLIEMLEDHDDVSAVSANYEFDEAIAEQVEV